MSDILAICAGDDIPFPFPWLGACWHTARCIFAGTGAAFFFVVRLCVSAGVLIAV